MPAEHQYTDLIDRYTPRSLPSENWALVRPYVTSVATTHVAPVATSPADLRNSLRALTTVATTAVSLGRDLTHTGVLDPDVIEYAINTSGLTSRVKGARRSLLVRLGQELNPDWPFAETGVRYGYVAPDAPYSDDEMNLLRQWAANHSTEYQRRNCALLLALGAGAGLRIGEMATLSAGDIELVDDVVVVTASGYRGAEPREVPVRAEWEDTVLDAVDGLGEDDLALFSNRAKATTESVSAILTRIGKSDRVHLDTRRLRTTWIVTLMHEYVPEAVIAPAAGLSSLQHYKKWLVPHEVDKHQARALLRGGTRYGSPGLRLI